MRASLAGRARGDTSSPSQPDPYFTPGPTSRGQIQYSTLQYRLDRSGLARPPYGQPPAARAGTRRDVQVTSSQAARDRPSTLSATPGDPGTKPREKERRAASRRLQSAQLPTDMPDESRTSRITDKPRSRRAFVSGLQTNPSIAGARWAFNRIPPGIQPRPAWRGASPDTACGGQAGEPRQPARSRVPRGRCSYGDLWAIAPGTGRTGDQG